MSSTTVTSLGSERKLSVLRRRKPRQSGLPGRGSRTLENCADPRSSGSRRRVDALGERWNCDVLSPRRPPKRRSERLGMEPRACTDVHAPKRDRGLGLGGVLAWQSSPKFRTFASISHSWLGTPGVSRNLAGLGGFVVQAKPKPRLVGDPAKAQWFSSAILRLSASTTSGAASLDNPTPGHAMARARDRGCTGARSAEAPAAASTAPSQHVSQAARLQGGFNDECYALKQAETPRHDILYRGKVRVAPRGPRRRAALTFAFR